MPVPDRWNFRLLPAFRQDMLIALALFAAGTLLYVSGIYPLSGDRLLTAPLWARLVVLAAGCSLCLLRRRAPALGLALALLPIGVDVVFGISTPMLLVLTDLTYSAALHGSERVYRAMIPLVAVCTLGITAFSIFGTGSWRTGVVSGIAAAAFLVIPVWWGANVRQHRDLAERERANAAQLTKIAELDRRAAVAAERGRMARDLHDVIAGHLSAIAIQSEAALSLAGTAPEPVRAVLTSVRGNSVEALDEMRTMIGLLRADGEPGDGPAAPARLAELGKLVDSARASGLDVRVDVELGDTPLPAPVDLAAYRIAQESLTNAAKHARGGKVTVSVRRSGPDLLLSIGNGLRGPTGDGEGTGIPNMAERAAAVGGTLDAGPVRDEWLVRAVLPAGKAGRA